MVIKVNAFYSNQFPIEKTVLSGLEAAGLHKYIDLGAFWHSVLE
ncbi:hypothetical protein [Allocoleopsis sp.]